MCCNNSCGSSCGCNCGCRCNCGCGCGDNGITTLPAFPDTPAFSGSTAGWPVYVSVPSFLWNGGEDTDSGCGCGCGCRG